MLRHGRSLLLIGQFLLRRRSSGHQWRASRRRCAGGGTIIRHRRILVRRFTRTCRLVRTRRFGWVGRLNTSWRCCCGRRNGRMLHNCRALRRHGRMGGIPSCNGARRGIDLGMRNHLRVGKLLWADVHQIARNRLAVAKCILRNRRRGHRLITVVDVVDVGYVRNVSDVDVAHIGHVDLPQIYRAVVIPGIERLARTERKPRCHTSNPNAYGEPTSADKGHEGRTVNRCDPDWSWQPAPPRPNLYPAAVVEGSKSPRRVVNPRPAPRLNPNPTAIAIRHPSHGNARRIPDRARKRLPSPRCRNHPDRSSRELPD